MKYLGFIFIAIGILTFAALTTVIIPALQLAQEPAEPDLKPYTEQELQGRSVYIKNGCIYCHSQQPRDPSFGVDQKRNWGRASTPGDYAFDRPHLLGTMRTGPDLLNIGARQPSQDWHLLHLYQPRAVLPNSVMPSYPYFFRHKDKIDPGEVSINIPSEWLREKGKKVIVTQEALDLVAYLKSLNRTYPATQKPMKERRRD
ncbi:MAG: cbb3-type cytochrome c oxidase subunit II [Pseudobdellovibrionaceae bacterium]